MAINFEAFNKGDRKEFNEVVSIYKSNLIYFADGFIRDYPQAEEIVMDAFLKLFNRCENFYFEHSIKSFLYTTVRNACLNYVAYNKRQMKLKSENPAPNMESVQSEIELNEHEMEIAKRLNDAIKKLSPTRRQVFELRFNEGMKNEEIAEKLGMTKGAVATAISEAIQNLRELL